MWYIMLTQEACLQNYDVEKVMEHHQTKQEEIPLFAMTCTSVMCICFPGIYEIKCNLFFFLKYIDLQCCLSASCRILFLCHLSSEGRIISPFLPLPIHWSSTRHLCRFSVLRAGRHRLGLPYLQVGIMHHIQLLGTLHTLPFKDSFLQSCKKRI